MLAIGCTGGIGAGKSTVSTLLAERGAIVVDADLLSREAVAPGTPGLAAVATRFGEHMIREDGALDRAALAQVVFGNDEERRALERIIHPIVEEGLRAALTEHAGSDAVVVLDVALLAERDGRTRYGLDGVLVVDADEESCLARLVGDRGMSEQDAKARIAAQMDRFERLRAADFVILNVGTREELAEMVNEAWAWMGRLRTELGR